MEYYEYFRLKGPPFQPASPDSAVYFSPTHLEGLATLESGLSGELTGLTLLTGEAGTGKTTLIYSLLQRDYKRVRIAHIDDPKLSFLEIMRVVLSQMNLYTTGSTKVDYLETLDRLLTLRGKEERIAIIVDESQLLSDEVLEELRLLSNRADRCLQLILVGHPELAERLKKPELRQLNQRISSRGVLKPLETAAQAVKYVECRLSAQGGNCPAIFERGALKRLLRRSDGIPRKINMLCHTAMQAAYNAGERKVSYKTANRIAAQYHDSVRITKQGFFARRLAMPALVAGPALASLLLLSLLLPNLRSSNHTVPAREVSKQTARPIAPTKPAERVAQVKPVTQVMQVEQPGVEEHPGSGAEPLAASSVAPRPAELHASLAPVAASSANEVRKVPTGMIAPNAAAASAMIQKQTGASAVPLQRSQVIVKDGDTLEKIALRYFRSNTGIYELIKANPQLTNINHLTVGQIIYLPAGIGGRFKRI
jgi:type II secretory pathway predicted ATPase ExeA/phage tail protein X